MLTYTVTMLHFPIFYFIIFFFGQTNVSWTDLNLLDEGVTLFEIIETNINVIESNQKQVYHRTAFI